MLAYLFVEGRCSRHKVLALVEPEEHLDLAVEDLGEELVLGAAGPLQVEVLSSLLGLGGDGLLEALGPPTLLLDTLHNLKRMA